MSEEYRQPEPGGLFTQPPPPIAAKPVQRLAAQSATEKEQRVLERFRTEGVVTCASMESDPHRGQATVRALRVAGHQIVTFKSDGVDCYRHDGYVVRIAVTEEMQAAYYLTSHWKQMAAFRREVDCYRCQHCRSGVELNIHHWCYDLFHEAIEDLSTYCETCHKRIHAHCTGSQMHFPRYVTTEVAEQLGWSK